MSLSLLQTHHVATVQAAHSDVHASAVDMFRDDILRRGLQIVGINIGLETDVHGITDENIIRWFNSDHSGRNNGFSGVETITGNCTERAQVH